MLTGARRVRGPVGFWILLLTVVTALAAFPRAGTAASPLSPFWEIYSGNPTDYDLYQLRFTYLGSQKKMVPSLGGVGLARAYEDSAFTRFQRELDYSNSMFTEDTLLVDGMAFMAFMDSIAAYPALQDTAFVAEPNASLMILRDFDPMTKCWEHLATRDETVQLFWFLHDSLPDTTQQKIVDRYRRQMTGVQP